MIDEILKKFGLKYEELTDAEIQTLNTQLEALQKNQLSVPRIKDYVSTMKDAVQQELVKVNIQDKNDIFLKARLKNYLLLEAFLTSPDKARKALEEAVGTLKT